MRQERVEKFVGIRGAILRRPLFPLKALEGQSLFAAACIYFLLLLTLSKLSRRLELPDRAASPRAEVDESFLSRLRPARLRSQANAAGAEKMD